MNYNPESLLLDLHLAHKAILFTGYIHIFLAHLALYPFWNGTWESGPTSERTSRRKEALLNKNSWLTKETYKVMKCLSKWRTKGHRKYVYTRSWPGIVDFSFLKRLGGINLFNFGSREEHIDYKERKERKMKRNYRTPVTIESKEGRKKSNERMEL